MDTLKERFDLAPTDPNFRYAGQRCDEEKSPEAAIRARKGAITSLDQFIQWRRSKGFPELSDQGIVDAFLRYLGEAPGEKAILNPIGEKR